jgi:hypothetical protein
MSYRLVAAGRVFIEIPRTTPRLVSNNVCFFKGFALDIESRNDLLEDILAPWAQALGGDGEGYKNHCYRVIHFTQALHPCSAQDKHKLVIAAAHHDIGIWSDHTVDYLPPSRVQVLRYLRTKGLSAWAEEVGLMVDEHHKISRFKDARFPLVDAFRRGDLVDFSMGWMRQGLPRSLIHDVQVAFPNAGFHKMLMKSAGQWFRQHPFSPPPFIKW